VNVFRDLGWSAVGVLARPHLPVRRPPMGVQVKLLAVACVLVLQTLLDTPETF